MSCLLTLMMDMKYAGGCLSLVLLTFVAYSVKAWH